MNLNPLQIVVIVAALAFLGFIAIITRDLRRKY